MQSNVYSATSLIETAKAILETEYHIPEPGLIFPDYVSGPKYSKWVNDLQIMQAMLSDECPLKEKLSDKKYYKDESVSTVREIIGILQSIVEWESIYGEKRTMKNRKKYDLFISHANADKSEYVDELNKVVRMLGVRIFYDTDTISWGDSLKKLILNGTASSEFAIIVISDNYFGREWTEIELKELLNRQNESGQKIVLPLLHNISIEEMKEHYPSLGDIMAISTDKYSKEEVALLFAKEFIKRLEEV